VSAQHLAERLNLASRIWDRSRAFSRGSAEWYRCDIVAGRVLSQCDPIAVSAMLNAYALGRMAGADAIGRIRPA
jgi:hypothetical protein